MRLIIYPNKYGWNSARKLAESIKNLGQKVLLVGRNNPRYKPKPTDVTVNWGNSVKPIWNIDWTLNITPSVKKAVNKLRTFELLREYNIPHPEWTTDYELAKTWQGDIVCRNVLNGFGGMGITICQADNVLKDAKLYVKYKKKKHEYRVHVFNGKVIDATWKRKKKGVEHDSKIRNYANGWVYCRDSLVVNNALADLAIRTCNVLGLDFGAIDIIYNEKENQYYVLEVNTAPGLTGTTLTNYTNAIYENCK